MDLAFESSQIKQNTKKYSVSILVLMDLAFEYSKIPVYWKDYRGFNPCFNGSCIRIPSVPEGLQRVE